MPRKITAEARIQIEKLNELKNRYHQRTTLIGQEEGYRATYLGFRNCISRSTVQYVIWRTAEDERVCPDCAARDGNRYMVGKWAHRTPDIPLHVGCRCYYEVELVEATRPVSRQMMEIREKFGKPVWLLLEEKIKTDSVNKICRDLGISTATFYDWARKFRLIH